MNSLYIDIEHFSKVYWQYRYTGNNIKILIYAIEISKTEEIAYIEDDYDTLSVKNEIDFKILMKILMKRI